MANRICHRCFESYQDKRETGYSGPYSEEGHTAKKCRSNLQQLLPQLESQLTQVTARIENIKQWLEEPEPEEKANEIS